MSSEQAMQQQIDTLNANFSRYMQLQERERIDAKEERKYIFKKLDEAAAERKSILIQTTKTNGRVNRLEGDQDAHGKRLIILESEQRDTLTFKGKTGVVVGIIITVITGLILALTKTHI